MPAAGHRKRLTVAQKKKPPGASDARWNAVPLIAAYANEHKLGAGEVAKAANVDPGSVSKWLTRSTVPDVETLLRLERTWNLALVSTRDGATGNGAAPIGVQALARAIGLHPSVAKALAGMGGGEGMYELDEALKRAVLGIVHILGQPLEVVIPIAQKLARQKGSNPGLSAAQWMEAIREDEDLPRRPPSGTFPSSGKIKLG